MIIMVLHPTHLTYHADSTIFTSDLAIAVLLKCQYPITCSCLTYSDKHVKCIMLYRRILIVTELVDVACTIANVLHVYLPILVALLISD